MGLPDAAFEHRCPYRSDQRRRLGRSGHDVARADPRLCRCEQREVEIARHRAGRHVLGTDDPRRVRAAQPARGVRRNARRRAAHAWRRAGRPRGGGHCPPGDRRPTALSHVRNSRIPETCLDSAVVTRISRTPARGVGSTGPNQGDGASPQAAPTVVSGVKSRHFTSTEEWPLRSRRSCAVTRPASDVAGLSSSSRYSKRARS